jgi:ubiquinone/menaquinone biosynthesis C-methylase UbiE
MTNNDGSTSGSVLTAEQELGRARLVGGLQERTIERSVPELLPYLKPGMNVLDVGCGPGTLTMEVAKIVAPGRVVGTDLVEHRVGQAIQQAKDSNIDNVTFQVGDAHTLDFPDNSFDLVFSNTVFHFFIDPAQTLKEQKRVAKKDALVIAAGIRDWGFAPRYPECPNTEAIWDAYIQYFESVRERHMAGNKVGLPENWALPEFRYIDLQTGRKCSESFTEAGLSDLTMQLKVERWLHPDIDRMEPHGMDIVPQVGDIDNMWLDLQQDVLDSGLLNEEMLNKARLELAEWYNNPHAFFYYALLFVAGKA